MKRASAAGASGDSIAAVSRELIVHCPACATGYRLPRGLLGPLGARVTCPACRQRFELDAAGEPADRRPGAAPSRRSPPPNGPGRAGQAMAADILETLERRRGPELARSARERRLFRDHGPELLEAYDQFRRAAGGQANALAFREELRRRWRVDLDPAVQDRA